MFTVRYTLQLHTWTSGLSCVEPGTKHRQNPVQASNIQKSAKITTKVQDRDGQTFMRISCGPHCKRHYNGKVQNNVQKKDLHLCRPHTIKEHNGQ